MVYNRAKIFNSFLGKKCRGKECDALSIIPCWTKRICSRRDLAPTGINPSKKPLEGLRSIGNKPAGKNIYFFSLTIQYSSSCKYKYLFLIAPIGEQIIK
jgi:hypothetical protein